MRKYSRCLLVCASLMLAAWGCSSTPAPWFRQEVREVTATVTALEPERRLLSLQSEAGASTTLFVGPEVRNFDQIKVGDRVIATYQEAIAAAVTRPDQAIKEPQVSAATERAAAGQSPRAEVAASMIVTVAIEAVDTKTSMLKFRRNDGQARTVRVEDPGAKEFIKGLKQGDLVTITYTEALALSVRPVAVM